MNRLIAVAVFGLLSIALPSIVSADPDRSLVRVVLEEKSAKVTAGRTRMDLVIAVMEALKQSERQCEAISVGPWLRLPDVDPKSAKLPTLTVCLDDRMEGADNTAYIAISNEVPVATVVDLSASLEKSGYADVRLLSIETLDQYLRDDG